MLGSGFLVHAPIVPTETAMLRIPFFTPRFNDEQIDHCVIATLANDGLFDMSQLSVTSHNGIITIRGRTRNHFEKTRVGNIAESGLIAARVRFQKIIDQVVVE